MSKTSKMTWKNTLYPHFMIGDMVKFANLARELKYDYFAWNGRIYSSCGWEPGCGPMQDTGCQYDEAGNIRKAL